MKPGPAPICNQRGWIGLVVLVFALVIVAVLAQTALKQYGLLSGFGAPQKSARISASASTMSPNRARSLWVR